MAKAPIPRPPNWNKIRKQVLERDNHTCQSCGSKPKSPHVHHIIPRDKGGNEELKNLITKCLGCHISEEYEEKERIKMSRVALTIIMIAAIGLILIPAAGAEAKSKFKIEVQICCVGSDSNDATIKVKLPDGSSTTKKVDLAKLAEQQDWDNVSVFIKLKHRYESFKVCLSGHGCQWGEPSQPVQFKGVH